MTEGIDPPASVEAEQSLLGAVLMNNAAFSLAADHVEAEHFSESIHQMLWGLIAGFIDSGRNVDPVTLVIALGPDGEEQFAGITVRQYVAKLAVSAVSIISAADYAKTIRSLWKRRRIMALGQQMSYRAQGGVDECDVEDLIEDLDTELTGIRFGSKNPGIVRIDEAVVTAIDQTARAYQGGRELGIESSVADIASLLGPLMAGDLITLLAASENGKTALAAQYIMDAAWPPEGSNRAPAPALMFSQEMMAVQIARRAIAYESGIATWKQRRGAVDVAEFDGIIAAAGRLKDLPIYIDQTANQKVSTIVRKARQMKKMYGIAFVVVDHLLEIRAEHPRQSEFDVIANAALELKTLAKEQDLTVLLLAQCTREAQKRDHWGVRSQDLYGGERVRQRSDIMFSIAIPTVWIADREPRVGTEEHFKWQEQMQKWHGKAEVGILKMRDGERGGRCTVAFDGARMRFSQRSDDERLPLRAAE